MRTSSATRIRRVSGNFRLRAKLLPTFVHVFQLSIHLFSSSDRNRNHRLGPPAWLRARSDPHLVLQQAAGAEEHSAHDVQGHGLVERVHTRDGDGDGDGDRGESCYKLYIVRVCMSVCVCVLCDSFKHLAIRV